MQSIDLYKLAKFISSNDFLNKGDINIEYKLKELDFDNLQLNVYHHIHNGDMTKYNPQEEFDVYISGINFKIKKVSI